MARRTARISTINDLAPFAHLARLAVAFDDASTEPGEFVIPEDLSALSDEELAALHTQAAEHFDALYGDGTGLTDEDFQALEVLTAGIETLLAELDTRSEAAREREAAAAALAARVRPRSQDGTDEAADDEADDEAPDAEREAQREGEAGAQAPAAAPAAGGEALPVAAGGAPARREYRVNLGGVHSRQAAAHLPRPAHEAQTMRDVVLASGDGSGFAQGQGVNWDEVGRIVDRRLMGYNPAQYEAAARAGQHLRQQFGVVTIRKPFDPELVVESSDPSHVDEVLQRAMSEARLPGGSLVASGGWCAPSETLYDLCELESRDGLFSLPEIAISRGGISFTPGPEYATIYANTGFTYTEAEDVGGLYVEGTPNTAGSKPCYKVPCPAFTEVRLNTAGVCITAGLLQQRGYPEVIARTVRGALVAHDHRMSVNVINAVEAGSTAVAMTLGTVGTVAPLLTAIELQVEHYRYVTRLARARTLEAVFPYWVRGAIRSDVALRAGSIDVLSVTDAQVDAWFRSRGINPQFVYDWQPITGLGADFKQWPTTVKFLLYAAGTWVKGGADVITLDTLYDSVLLGHNDYTALFTEEGWLAAKLCHDSRVITVPICATGATGAAVAVDCDGTPAAP